MTVRTKASSTEGAHRPRAGRSCRISCNRDSEAGAEVGAGAGARHQGDACKKMQRGTQGLKGLQAMLTVTGTLRRTHKSCPPLKRKRRRRAPSRLICLPPLLLGGPLPEKPALWPSMILWEMPLKHSGRLRRNERRPRQTRRRTQAKKAAHTRKREKRRQKAPRALWSSSTRPPRVGSLLRGRNLGAAVDPPVWGTMLGVGLGWCIV
mmetsp:Transcript_3128/g.8277  ORF Transcript_3128/g.8277 Transcript_3128/m.8277 type:complete len:207 (+) Transcript_3128:2779-3399(+)